MTRANRAAPTRRLIVWGASGHGKVVAETARLCGYEIEGFFDDDQSKQGQLFFGARICVGRERFAKLLQRAKYMFIGIGDNHTRERLQAIAVKTGFTVPPLVHPSAVVSRDASLGAGTVVMALAAVNPDARIGAGVILNTGAIVEHDCDVGDFAHLSPNSAIGGGVRIGSRASLGLGAVVLPGRSVGAGAVIGAGAVVIDTVDAETTMAGVPARPIQKRTRVRA